MLLRELEADFAFSCTSDARNDKTLLWVAWMLVRRVGLEGFSQFFSDIFLADEKLVDRSGEHPVNVIARVLYIKACKRGIKDLTLSHIMSVTTGEVGLSRGSDLPILEFCTCEYRNLLLVLM